MKNRKNRLLLVEQLEDRLTPSPVLLSPTDPSLSGTGETVGTYATNPTNAPTSPLTSQSGTHGK